MRLLLKLRNKPFYNEVHFFIIPLIIIALGFINAIFYIFLIPYLIFLHKKTNIIIPILVLISIFLLEMFVMPRISLNQDKSYITYVYRKEDNKVYAKTMIGKVLIYDNKDILAPGDLAIISYTRKESDSKSYDTDFDYEKYLLGKRIFGAYYINKYEIKNHFFSFGILYNKLDEYYKNKLDSNSYQYVKSIVLGKNELDSKVKDGYSILGLSHILAISGMHILLIYNFLVLLIKKVFRRRSIYIPLIIVFFYIAFIGFPISALRALLFLIIGILNQKGEVNYSKLDILSLSFIIMVIYSPYMIYQTSFILSFIVSFLLIYINEIVSYKGLKYKYISYLIIYLSTLPFIINMTNKLNFLSFFSSPIVAPIVTYILLPTAYIISLLPFLDFVLKYIFILVNYLMIDISSLPIGIAIPSINVYVGFIYYVLFILLIISLAKNKNIICKEFVFIIGYITLIASFNYINPITKVTFIDVGQGDSCLITFGNNKGNIIIDSYNCFDYIRSRGIKNIDYLILTHSDEDHIKDATKIIEYFDVNNVLLSAYDNDYGINGEKIKAGSSIKINNVVIKVLGPINQYKEKNSNSLVLQMKINGVIYLFTGDMTKEEEHDLVSKYNNTLKSDCLKVGHHGSNTSSSAEFIEAVKPKYSIISVAKNNKYKLPNDVIVKNLESISTVYCTKDYGNITFYNINNKLYIYTYRKYYYL